MTPNRTYLSVERQDITRRKIPFNRLSPNKQIYHPIYPNYRRLELVNQGLWEWKSEKKEILHPRDYWRIAHAITNQLEMTDYQKRRFHYLFWKISPQQRQQFGLSVEKLIFGICMLVCWEDGRKASPRQKPWDPEFERLATRLGIFKPLSLLEKAKRLVKPWLTSEEQRRSPPKLPRNPFSPAGLTKDSTDSPADAAA